MKSATDAFEDAEEAREEKRAGWDCDHETCGKTKDDGTLWRVNPKGVKGVFMCADHARETNAFENREAKR
jgi:hypothetical protein